MPKTQVWPSSFLHRPHDCCGKYLIAVHLFLHQKHRFGPTRFSVVPKTAVAKISVRFVPRQDPNQIIHCLRKHIESEFSKLGSSNSIR